MSDNSKPDTKSNDNAPSSANTIITILIVSVLLIVCIVVIIYILQSNVVKPLPLSNFKYGDVVVIRPAILADITNPDQYLCKDDRYRYQNSDKDGYYYGSNGYAATFTGKSDDAHSQWILSRHSTAIPGNKPNDAENSLVYGFGNRFYLHNRSYPAPNEQAGRLRYQMLNEYGFGQCYNTTPVVVGSNPNQSRNFFESEILVYFMPTNYKDVYFLLFPSCSDYNGGNILTTNTTNQPNTGILNMRPWAQNVYNRKSVAQQCIQCNDPGTYNPYDSNNVLNQNVLIADLGITAVNPNNLPPYANANTRLFKVTTV